MDIEIETKDKLLGDLLDENKKNSLTKSLLKDVFINKDEILVIILLYKSDGFKQIMKPFNLL